MIPTFTLTLKNYRCFIDESPMVIPFDAGFTALIGPNNSGKTTAIRSVYELRNLWGALSSLGIIAPKIKSKGLHEAGFLGVRDPTEPYSKNNNRPLSVELRIVDQIKEPALIGWRATSSKEKPALFSFDVYSNSQTAPLQHLNLVQGKWQSNGIFHSSLYMQNVLRALSASIYIGAFRNAVNDGASSYYDLEVGTAFVQRWDEWKSGEQIDKAERIREITTVIRKIFGIDELEIYASQSNKEMIALVNGKHHRLSELGSGFAQSAITLGNAAIRKPSFILIDEPESHLHPSLQIEFLTTLASYASHGILFSTHSLGLARSTSERIYSLRREDGYTKASLFDKTPRYAEFLGEMNYSSFAEIGFETVVLVEGVKELRTIQQLLRKMKKDQKVLLLPLGGSQLINGNVEFELNEHKRITPNVRAVIDSERTSEGAALSAERQKFVDSCQKLSIPCLVTERRAIENYFPDAAIKDALGEGFSALTPFQTLKDAKQGWSKSDNWRIAAKVNFSDISQTDLGKFLNQL